MGRRRPQPHGEAALTPAERQAGTPVVHCLYAPADGATFTDLAQSYNVRIATTARLAKRYSSLCKQASAKKVAVQCLGVSSQIRKSGCRLRKNSTTMKSIERLHSIRQKNFTKRSD